MSVIKRGRVRFHGRNQREVERLENRNLLDFSCYVLYASCLVQGVVYRFIAVPRTFGIINNNVL
jgi:hypothetical protein